MLRFLTAQVLHDLYLYNLGRIVAVKLKNGSVIKSNKAVVSNVTPFDTAKMLDECYYWRSIRTIEKRTSLVKALANSNFFCLR